MKHQIPILLAILLCICILSSCSHNAIPCETKIQSYTFSNESGSKIIYHICQTTYQDTVPEIMGLNTDALKSVFDPDSAAVAQELEVSGFPARIYRTDGISFLCWTYSAEISCVLEYDSGTSDAEMIRTAESTYQNASK